MRLTRKARNFCASAWCELDGEDARAGDVDHVPGVAGCEEVLGGVDLRRAELVAQAEPVVVVDHTELSLPAVHLGDERLVVGVDVLARIGLGSPAAT